MFKAKKNHASDSSGDIVLACESDNDDDDSDQIGHTLIRCWSTDYEAVLPNEHHYEQLEDSSKTIILQTSFSTATDDELHGTTELDVSSDEEH